MIVSIDRAIYANANALLVRKVPAIVEGFNGVNHLFASLNFFGINDALRGLHIAPPTVIDGKHNTRFDAMFTVLAIPKIKQYLRLSAFDSQVWQKRFNKIRSHFVCDLPRVKRLAILGAGLLHPYVTAKVMSQKLDSLRSNLLDSNTLAKYGLGGIATNPHGVGATLDCEVTICVHYPGHVCFISFVHNNITPICGDVIIQRQ